MIRDGVSKEAIFLAVGDFVVYFFSLILALTFRYSMLPGRALLSLHLQSFWLLFLLFMLVNFAVGLYDIRSALRRGWNGAAVLTAQLVNAILGVLYFYFIPAVIAPKANLFIFLIISTLILVLWRAVMYPVVSIAKKQTALLIGSGKDIDDLAAELSGRGRYGLYFKETISPRASAEEMKAAIAEAVKRTDATIVVADLHNDVVESTMPLLYSLVFSGMKFVDASRLYEAVFGRVPLGLVGERWLVENSGTALGNRRVYDLLKRGMDILMASILGAVSLVVYPFIWIAVKLDDRGPLFVTQERIGKNGRPIRIVKFRSMTANDGGSYLQDGKSKLKVTRVGQFIRLTRIDELPQLWSVLAGHQSLIGPRPELPPLVRVYEEKIPYYNARHLITPGLSGWAQIYHRAHPHHAVAIEDASDKLSYDLYYVKNRSFGLDLKIVLRTIQILLQRVGK